MVERNHLVVNLFRLNKLIFSLIFLLTFTINSCMWMEVLDYSQDVTKNSTLWHGYKYGQIFSLKYDMFLRIYEKHALPLERVSIVPPRDLTRENYALIYNGPSSISEYKKLYNNWPRIKGIIKEGTRIKCSKLMKWVSINGGESIYILNFRDWRRSKEICFCQFQESSTPHLWPHRIRPRLFFDRKSQ